MTATPPAPVIACNLDPEQAARLRAHPARPVVLEYAEGDVPWNVPPKAEVLMTFARGWRGAPAKRPEGWPGNLKWMQIAAAGIDAFPDWAFDVPLVSTGRGISADAIAEYVLAAIFAHEKGFFDQYPLRDAAGWAQRPLGSVAGKRLGLAGFGAIGARTAELAAALGMQIAAVTRSATVAPHIRQYPTLAQMIAETDHLVLAVPLTAATRGMLNADILAHAKPGLHVINVCRGEVVDDDALWQAIETGQVAAATLDVTSPEPLPPGHRFYTHPRIRVTPHISWTSDDNADRMAAKLARNLDAWLQGQPPEDVLPKGREY
ncbi:NAD(P)-dependent oxidoreductase [Paracoccus shanxieyensis]|nr:NAD(P)-dependent oxidoreductase [Paracoccus shanxieyensis]